MIGEPHSHVFGSIIDGVFEGKIITDTHAYYVENAKHYFPNRSHLDHGFHSIIYNERDVVDDPYAHKRDGKDMQIVVFFSYPAIPFVKFQFFFSMYALHPNE